ncbi:MAG: hypothetical protein LQ346_000156 [Caloplaca aetnensis]|nr:MAG: hypothetical protein LQ346_000156 [Caloplaca aetnensis]
MESTSDQSFDPFQASSIPSITKAEPVDVKTTLPTPPASKNTSNTSTDTDETSSPNKLGRPRLTHRKSSGTMIIPRDAPTAAPAKEFPPDDARAMSPRRSSEETDKMLVNVRLSIQHEPRRALDMQSGLAAIANQIETVARNCESLDRQNQALQDAIGDMTRSLSRESLSSKKK